MIEMTDLLPCPFCGGKAKLIDHEAGIDGMPRGARNPSCCKCGTNLGYCSTPEDAIAEWNTRALAPALRGVLDHVERDGLNEGAQTAFLVQSSARLAVSGALRAMLAEQEDEG